MTTLPAKLIVVDDVFALTGGVLAFTPSVPFELADGVHLRAGDHLELRRPDGTVLHTTLFGIVRFTPSNGTVGISLNALSKAEVPIGTEIWKVG
jgi:hypothetical protein